jgi:hypothetical protein
MTTPLLALLAACDCPPPTFVPPTDACEGSHAVAASLDAAGPATWDPVFPEVEGPECGFPQIGEGSEFFALDEAGAEHALDPRAGTCGATVAGVEAGTRLAALGVRDAWMGPLLQEQEVVLPLDEQPAFEAWGLDPAFDAATLVDRAWALDPVSIHGCPEGLPELAAEALPGAVWLEVIGLGEGSATFRLVQEVPYSAAGACVYVEDEAKLSATGELTWEIGDLDLASEPPLAVHNLHLLLGFDAAATEAAGGALRGALDLGPAGEDKWPDLCELAESFGWICEPCPGEDAEPSCLEFDFFGLRLAEDGLPWDSDDLPACEVTHLDCGVSVCSARSAPAQGLLLLAATGLATLRRRRAR